MKSFSIIAIAALAYTANASSEMRAWCKVVNSVDEKVGRFLLTQDLNTE